MREVLLEHSELLRDLWELFKGQLKELRGSNVPSWQLDSPWMRLLSRCHGWRKGVGVEMMEQGH